MTKNNKIIANEQTLTMTRMMMMAMKMMINDSKMTANDFGNDDDDAKL